MNDQQLEVFLAEKLKVIYAYLIKMGAKKEDAEDVLQETAYQFIRYINEIEEAYAVRWLFRVAINQYYDLLRKQKVRSEKMLHLDVAEIVGDESAEHIILQLEVKADIIRTLERIKQNEKELLLLKYSANLSLKEIAELFYTTDKTVKTQLARARKQFIRHYKGGTI